MPNSKLLIEIGANIKRLRLAKGKGQTAVAQSLGISVAALSKIENGQTDINLSRLAQIAKYFGVAIVSVISKDATVAVPQDLSDELEALKSQLAVKDAELMKLQKKVIDLYEKLGL